MASTIRPGGLAVWTLVDIYKVTFARSNTTPINPCHTQPSRKLPRLTPVPHRAEGIGGSNGGENFAIAFFLHGWYTRGE